MTITALSDGRVWIEHGYYAGSYSDWTTDRRRVRISPERFATFREHLRPYRPHGELDLYGQPACAIFWNDVDGARVIWRDAAGSDKLVFNFGCDPETRLKEAQALRAASDLLGIADLKLPWGQWVATSRN